MADTQTDFLISMAVVIAIAAIIVILFNRLRQPMILGYLVAGIIVGFVARDIITIEASVEQSIRLLAQLGVILITFSIGLEFSLRQLRRIGVAVATAAALEIAMMIGIGYQLGRALGWSPLEATLLGAMLSVASTMIVVRALKESGGLDNERARLIVGLLVVEDLAAVLILAAVSALMTEGSVSTIDLTELVMWMGIFIGASIVIGVALVPPLVDYVGRQRSNELLVITVIGLCFSMAVFAALIGFSVAIGAFVMGVIISESKYVGDVIRRIEPIRDLFGAIFFITVGMLVDPTDFTSITLLATALIIVVVFVVAKMFASSLSTFVCGFGARASVGAGLGMLAIGEFSLIIASLTLPPVESGTIPSTSIDISQELYPIIVLVTTISALIVPYTIRYTNKATGALEGLVPRSILVLASYLNLVVRNLRRRSQSSLRISNEMRSSISRLVAYIVMMVAVLVLAWSMIPHVGDYGSTLGVKEDWLLLAILTGTLVVVIYGMYGIWSRTIRLIEIGTSEAMLNTRSAENIGYQATASTLKFAFLAFYMIVGFILVSPLIGSLIERNIMFAILAGSIIAIALVALWRSVQTIDSKLEEMFVHREAMPFGDSSRDLAEIEDIIAEMESGRR
jgi:CPA2 family monovalent cation:H+ antiporter-2